jgi:uroporphyrinogen decarboxylase
MNNYSKGTTDLKDSRLLRAYRGEKLDRPPVWFMRQAGRYLPEYLELRAKHTMLQAIQTPEIATEITLQPLRRFPLDAAIIFADILTPLLKMGLDVVFEEGKGPVIQNPVRSQKDVEQLIVPEAGENCQYTIQALSLAAKELSAKGIPVLGFSGAPFTLSCYLIGAKDSGVATEVKRFMLSEPKLWHMLQEKLAKMVARYLVAQANAGASAVQLFDTWAGAVSPSAYRTYVLPYIKKIIDLVRAEVKVPIVYFSTGSATLLHEIATLEIDVLGVDWRNELTAVSKQIGHKLPLQGNLDPAFLFAPGDVLVAEVKRVLEDGRSAKSHIFNLGHGILPKTPISNVELAVATIIES